MRAYHQLLPCSPHHSDISQFENLKFWYILLFIISVNCFCLRKRDDLGSSSYSHKMKYWKGFASGCGGLVEVFKNLQLTCYKRKVLTAVAFTQNCLNCGMNYRCCVFPDTTFVCVSCMEKRGLVKPFPQYLLHWGGEGRLARLELAVSSELLWQLWQKSFPVTAAANVSCHPPTCCQHSYLIFRWNVGLYLQTLCLSYI